MVTVKRRKSRAGRRLCLLLAVILIFAVLVVAYINAQIDKIMDSVVKRQVENKITEIINDAVARIASEAAYASGTFACVSYSSEGKITAVSANSILINRMRADIVAEIATGLSELEKYGVPISYANLFGEGFLSSFLPETYLNVKVQPFGGVTANVVSELTCAGINQSKHTVNLVIDAGVAGLVKDKTIEVCVSTNVCIAETVIVGEVPSVWLGTGS